MQVIINQIDQELVLSVSEQNHKSLPDPQEKYRMFIRISTFLNFTHSRSSKLTVHMY